MANPKANMSKNNQLELIPNKKRYMGAITLLLSIIWLGLRSLLFFASLDFIAIRAVRNLWLGYTVLTCFVVFHFFFNKFRSRVKNDLVLSLLIIIGLILFYFIFMMVWFVISGGRLDS